MVYVSKGQGPRTLSILFITTSQASGVVPVLWSEPETYPIALYFKHLLPKWWHYWEHCGAFRRWGQAEENGSLEARL